MSMKILKYINVSSLLEFSNNELPFNNNEQINAMPSRVHPPSLLLMLLLIETILYINKYFLAHLLPKIYYLQAER